MSGPKKPRHGGAVLSAFAAMVRHACPDDGDARLADEAHDYLSGCMQAAKREWEATLAALDAAEERAEAAEETARTEAAAHDAWQRRAEAAAKRGIAPWLVEERDAAIARAEAAEAALVAEREATTAELAAKTRREIRAAALREATAVCVRLSDKMHERTLGKTDGSRYSFASALLAEARDIIRALADAGKP